MRIGDLRSARTPHQGQEGKDIVVLDRWAEDRTEGAVSSLARLHAEPVDQEMVLRARDARRDAGIDQVRPAEQVDEPIAGGEIDADLRLGLSHVASGY